MSDRPKWRDFREFFAETCPGIERVPEELQPAGAPPMYRYRTTEIPVVIWSEIPLIADPDEEC